MAPSFLLLGCTKKQTKHVSHLFLIPLKRAVKTRQEVTQWI